MTVPDGFPKLDKSTRPWTCRKQDDTCTRAKPCRSCLGARNRRSGMRKQRDARKALESVTGTTAAQFVGMLGNEESWRLPVRVEVKSGAQAGPIWTRYTAAEQQSDASRSQGDTRPFVFVAMPTGTTDGLMVCRLSALEQITTALLDGP